MYYTLDDNDNPVPCDDVLTWGKWFGQPVNRHLADDTINGCRISTVFLGLDHSFGSGQPVLWETMIFGGTHDQYQDRYTSKADALEGHKKAVALVVAG